MPQYSFDEHYVEALRVAMRRAVTHDYVLSRLPSSLRNLGLHEDCVMAVVSLLSELTKQHISVQHLVEQVVGFQGEWRIHLDRKYLNGYEATRWHFMSKYVFEQLEPENSLGRCLDVGCGRGCIAASLVRDKLASSAVGIDTANFTPEWNERESEWGEGASSEDRAVVFKQVPVGRIESWLRGHGRFDTILLLYVLHHSEEYWAVRTLKSLKGSLSPTGRVIVLEDSLVLDAALSPLSKDNPDLTRTWRNWAAGEDLYCLTAAYDAQVVLDFVAVQLLAGFWDVRMPCNYRTSVEWQRCFEALGYEVKQVKYIGFAEDRDIDVPQTFFVLKLPDGTGGRNADPIPGSV